MNQAKEIIRNYILTEYLPGESPANLKDDTPLRTSGILDSMATLALVSFLEDHSRSKSRHMRRASRVRPSGRHRSAGRAKAGGRDLKGESVSSVDSLVELPEAQYRSVSRSDSGRRSGRLAGNVRRTQRSVRPDRRHARLARRPRG